MSTAVEVNNIALIGETAGEVWRVLDQNGSMSLTRLAKSVDAPRDLVMQAIGWLAREGKVAIEDDARSKMISLRTPPAAN